MNGHDTTANDLRRALPASDDAITVRTMRADDAGSYAAGTADEAVKLFAHLPLDHYTPSIVREMIDGAIEDGLRNGSLAVLTVADRASDEFLGSLVLFDITERDAEIGYWVAPEHRGRGIARRALQLGRRIARTLGLEKLRARTVVGNPASERSLLAGGFRQEGPARPGTAPSGKLVTTLHFVSVL